MILLGWLWLLAGLQKAPEGTRKPQKVPKGPRRLQKAPEGPRRPQEAPEGPKGPEGTRRPQKALLALKVTTVSCFRPLGPKSDDSIVLPPSWP